MTRVSTTDLRDVADVLLAALGVPADLAPVVAENLVRADCRGHGSHGVRLLPTYAQFVEEGILDPAGRPEVKHEGPGFVQFDGRRGFGQVAGAEAVERGIELAEGGVAMVGLDETTHLGRIGEFGERAAEAGRLFAALVNVTGDDGIVAPLGSHQGRFGTNPVCFAVPTFGATDFPVVLDMATSQVAVGKLRRAAAEGSAIDPEWTTTETGEPVAEAAAFVDGEGAILPLGGRTTGHKGYGLAVVAELFGGIVGDGLVSGQEGVRWGNSAAFFLADPLACSDREAVAARVEAIDRLVRETPYPDAVATGPSSYGDRAYLPGEPEHRRAEQARAEGVDVPAADLAALYDLGDEHGVADALPAGWQSP